MKNSGIINVFAFVLLTVMASSCSAIGGIFKAGMGLGIFVAVAVVLVIVLVVMRVNKK